MSENKHTIIYSAEDIQQYLSGKLSPLQMNAMEKAALDDPFLAEAIEGYEGMPAGEWETALAAVKQQFAEKESGAKIIALPGRKNNWLKIAAAILLIGGTATLAYLSFSKNETVQIAKADPVAIPSSKDDTVIPQASTVKVIPVTPEDQLSEKITTQKNTRQTDITTATEKDQAFVYQPAPSKAEELIVVDKALEKTYDAQKLSDDGVTYKQVPAAPPIVSLKNTANAAENGYNRSYNKTTTNSLDFTFDKSVSFQKAETKKEQPFNHNFSAQVMGIDNTPLPFANISIKNENFGTYADAKGNFRLASADSILTVEVKSVGYVPKIYTIKSNLVQNKITLVEEDIAAKENTVVNGYTAKAKVSRRATLVKDSVINVEPADGWDNYNTYVTNNIVIPDDIVTNNIHGQVELSFDVTENGKITNIKVDKSLCNNSEDVARKLIEQGPQWKVKKGKKGKGKVTLQF